MKALEQKVQAALAADKAIVTTLEQASSQQGYTEEYMEYLGLTRNDLKKLERHGLALRGYTKNVWLPGETMPNKKVAEGNWIDLPDGSRVPDRTYRGKGMRVRWVLIAKGEGNG